MAGRRRRVGAGHVVVFAIACAAFAFDGSAAAGDASEAKASVYEQRLAYRRAVQALRAGRSRDYRRQAEKLGGYALQPYLAFHEAQGAISRLSAKRAKELRGELAATPLGERFFRQWLNAQVRRGRWDVYLANYEPTDDPAGRCNHLRALYRSGERDLALRQVRDLWVAAQSMPKTCDPLFEAWIGAGYLDQDTVWARLMLVLDAGETGLGRYLLRFLDSSNAAAGQLTITAHTRPRTVRNLSRFADTEGGRRALRHGLLRYAKDDAEKALSVWQEARRRYAFGAADRHVIEERLVAAAAEQGQVPKAAAEPYSAGAVERIAQALVRHQHWQQAAHWIRALPVNVAAKPVWRYWLGRALIDGGGDPAGGRGQLAAIAGLRTYYGFLAAEGLGREPQLNNDPPRQDLAAQKALLQVPPVLRMRELYAVGDLVNARREWRFALTVLDRDQQRHLVELTASFGWVEQAIFGARDAELGDMLAQRFPMPHLHVYRRYATEVDLPPHLLLAISRQESAFDPKAVSEAGARGLMQLMPATARSAADQARLKRPSTSALFDPEVNVRLGASHFAELMQRYDGNRAVAAAAYNAGEHRVGRWLKEAEGMPTPVWIERIPFRETRDYVKGIIAFDCVYSRLLNTPRPVLAAHERTIGRFR